MGGKDSDTACANNSFYKVALKGRQKIPLSWRWSQRSFLSFLKQETRMPLMLKGRGQPKESEEKVECIIIPSRGPSWSKIPEEVGGQDGPPELTITFTSEEVQFCPSGREARGPWA